MNICVMDSGLNFVIIYVDSRAQPEIQQSSSYSVDISYHPNNGHIDLSPNAASHQSENPTGTLVSRTQKHQTTQQVRCKQIQCY
jgi:hypothetical protein